MNNLFEVALFPIPNLVAFPGTIVPLHVFEPRYRQLVHDCVRDERMVAVSHVLGTVSDAKAGQDLETALHSNQATYKSCSAFSAGLCRLEETLDDGRLLATVHMSHRLTLEEDIQTLPYRIVRCMAFEDDDSETDAADNQRLQARITAHLVNLCRDKQPDLAAELDSEVWQDLTPTEFSFSVFQLLRFEADVMQNLLEMTSTNGRLARIDQALLRA